MVSDPQCPANGDGWGKRVFELKVVIGDLKTSTAIYLTDLRPQSVAHHRLSPLHLEVKGLYNGQCMAKATVPEAVGNERFHCPVRYSSRCRYAVSWARFAFVSASSELSLFYQTNTQRKSGCGNGHLCHVAIELTRFCSLFPCSRAAKHGSSCSQSSSMLRFSLRAYSL
jgi:hypothetical protein